MKDMLLEKFLTSLRMFFKAPPRFHQMGLIWGLSLANLAVILLLSIIMMLLSNRVEFLIMTLILLGSAGSVILFLLFKLQKIKLRTQKKYIESKAYEEAPLPLLILSADLEFCYRNKEAQQKCWWAESIPLLRKVLSFPKSKAALDRLMGYIQEQKEGKETLYFQGEAGEEVWCIHTIPFLGKKTLWQCTNITQDIKEHFYYTSQIQKLNSFLNHAAEGLFSFNDKENLIFCNDKFADWLGYSRAQLEGMPIGKLVVKPKGLGSIKFRDLQGNCDFISASSRIKSAFLEQDLVSTTQGIITYSKVNIYNLFASYSDLRRILEMAPLPIVFLNENGQIQESNLLFREKFWSEDTSIQGVSFLDLVIDTQREEIQQAFRAYLEGKKEQIPLEIQLNDTKESIVSAYISSMSVKNKMGLFIQLHDITEQKRFESQLAQSQKMQAVGQLAGGIAHDFNNLLTAMMGFCDLMLLRQTPGDQSFTDVMQIKQNATRATNLVRQLLAFSRQQELELKVLNITDSLAELSALLRRLLGANVDLKIKHARDLSRVFMDKGHFDQIIMNVMVNARDAMEGGGTITLTTQNYETKKSKRLGHNMLAAGSYILMEIMDTGEGIKPEIIDRIFDPFFSTKKVGEGTGLGLSTVYGIVKQAGGVISVASKVGEGTTFSIYLPHCTPEETAKALLPKQGKPHLHDLTGSSTIMLVEDEDAVRLFSARALRSKGYKVIEAIHGEDALEYMKSNTENIDLVISDVIMPNMDGPTFVNEMRQLRENQKVLFISGYAEETFFNRIKDDAQIHFLPKPFTLVDLATRVKEILNEDNVSEENTPKVSTAVAS